MVLATGLMRMANFDVCVYVQAKADYDDDVVARYMRLMVAWLVRVGCSTDGLTVYHVLFWLV